ncbi:MAG TPA: hypothetical protein VFB42_00740 [Gaiellaceae bacterium]|nr:hypothetical protein [Gaiellaceae bacterium]
MATDTPPPAPGPSPELADDVISAVARHVEVDLAPVEAELLERLEEPAPDPPREAVLERAERLACEAIDTTRSDELVAECARGLAGAREHFLAAARCCDEAAEELRARRGDSWIARAIRHRLAFEAVWDTVDERHGVQWHECEA